MFDFDNLSAVNTTAFAVTTALAAATAGSVYATVAAVQTARTVAAVAYGILSATTAGAGLGSITAWLDTSSTTVSNYFANVRSHCGVAIAGMYQFVTQSMFQALVDGVRLGISDLIRGAISGRSSYSQASA